LEGETEVLGEKLPQRHYVHHKSHMIRPGFEPGQRGGKPETNFFLNQWGGRLVTGATTGLLYQPQDIVMVIVEKLVE
jgi:hypothetical protein